MEFIDFILDTSVEGIILKIVVFVVLFKTFFTLIHFRCISAKKQIAQDIEKLPEIPEMVLPKNKIPT